ncbi:hypothetical protein ASG31_15300 [Chryseobacterium sp. Leaf404]|uniref:tetratricopeptide repeat protein n=1 Tax=unclassified Chryseobacterium TaxID=2593645 RepID=UPI0006F4DDD5|nr:MULTISPECIES: hypothetical protein [unclassified Chryseobacterium]KQT15294.1 hypothetical protein ASG31_15300 [Chryseobacterium sp. Leaf404]
MEVRVGISNKLAMMGVAAFAFVNVAYAQSADQGNNLVESYKFGQAKEVFSGLVAKEPTDKNFFYLGNTYLSQPEPDFAKATEAFNKGIALDAKKSYYSRLGLASVKLGKGDKSAVAEIKEIVKDSREKDTDLLAEAGKTLVKYDRSNDPRYAVEVLNVAIEKSQKNGTPAWYLYSLGDAYSALGVQTKSGVDYGNAMTAFEKALPTAKSKAVVYTRMGALWMNAKAWEKAKTNLDMAVKADPGYAPAYKYLGTFFSIYQDWAQASANYKKYLSLADNDPNTVLDYAKLAFLSKDFEGAGSSLNSVFDKIQDPIKFRIKAYLDYQNKDYASAKTNIETFIAKADKSRVQPSDTGLQGLIQAGLAKANNDQAQMAEAKAKIAVAKAAKDETFKWDEEFEIASGSKKTIATVAGPGDGPTSDAIDALNKKLSADPKDSDALYKLANEYQTVENWKGAAYAWQRLTDVLPTWESGYYGLGYAFQKAGDAENAITSYERYIATLASKTPAEKEKAKETLASVYFNLANLTANDKERSLQYINKSIETFSTPDAVTLKEKLSK